MVTLFDLIDVLYVQPTFDQRRDQAVAAPTEKPEKGGAAVRSTKGDSMSVSPHRGNRIEW